MPKLEEYNQKRDFDRTPEPAGEPRSSPDGLRFVVQHHLARADHYDFRLEWDGALLSWAVPKGPSFDTRDKRLAVRVEDHPLDYRDFEGTIPKGEYGGGAVMLWDEGYWEPRGDAGEGLGKGALKFTLHGRRLRGNWALVRLKTGDNWLLIKEKDAYAQTDAGISGFDTSIRTGRAMAEIEAGDTPKLTKNPFARAEAQLAVLVGALPADGDWLYELKYDGYRILAYAEGGGGVRLETRGGGDYTRRFHAVADALAGWAAGRAMVLDGEMVVADETGRTDFQALQSYLKNPAGRNLAYMVFDLLALDGADLRPRPLTERKETLEKLLADAPPSLRYSRHVRGGGRESLAAACGAGLEGIIGKKADSPYAGGRGGDWIKLKCGRRQEFVIGGYTLSDKKTRGVSSLLLGLWEDGELRYAGRAGTGISADAGAELEAEFGPLAAARPPFGSPPEPRPNEKITWLEPRLAAEIQFAEWTGDGLLRQASFKGLRADKDPRDIGRETEKLEAAMEESGGGLVVEGVKISNPDKVIFEDGAVTKADVVRYYAQVSGRMLPYVAGRILSIVRCPKGVSQACFYKKHPGPDAKGVVTVETQGEEYFYLADASGLVAEAQMGTLEFHAWGSRVETLEQPDMMVFDLDPDEGMALDAVRQGVRDVGEILGGLGLRSFLKTSGGKGYHVVVPLRPAASWEIFHDFARRVAEVMVQKWPDRYTANVRKARRAGKIFIDWIRNGRGATSVAPYSIRARKGARVSMPIAWDELDAVAPDGVTMAGALARLAAPDPWRDFFACDQALK